MCDSMGDFISKSIICQSYIVDVSIFRIRKNGIGGPSLGALCGLPFSPTYWIGGQTLWEQLLD